MRRPAIVLLVLMLAALPLSLTACDGSAPMVQSPSRAINNDGMVRQACIDNAPPPGYRGPVSPYSGACLPESGGPVVAPAGVHDYSKGMPPQVAR